MTETEKESFMKRLSNLMLLSTFMSTLFYAASYPYIYAEMMKVIPQVYISIEQLLACIGTILFCRIWNRFSDRLFRHYRLILWAEMTADVILFADVLFRHDLSFYFLFNVIIYAVITRNLCCGGTKMRALVHPSEQLREQYDNNSNVVNSAATILGAGFAALFPQSLTVLFVLALIGNVVDNIFYLYIYHKLTGGKKYVGKESDSPEMPAE